MIFGVQQRKEARTQGDLRRRSCTVLCLAVGGGVSENTIQKFRKKTPPCTPYILSTSAEKMRGLLKTEDFSVGRLVIGSVI